MENQGLKRLVMGQNLQVMFPNQKQMVKHVILSLVGKTMEKIYVMLALASCVTKTYFDLWMSTSRYNTFAQVS